MTQHASNAATRLGLIKEVTAGVTPATPTLAGQKFDTFSFTTTIEELLDTSKSNVRGYSTSVGGNKSFSGTLEGPLSLDNYDTLLETALYSTFATNVLKLGSTMGTLSIEEAIPDANVPFYRLYKGVLGNGVTITAPASGLVTVQFPVMALSETVSNTSVSASPYTAPAAHLPFTHCGGVISEGGSPIAYVTSVALTLAQNTATNMVWGSCSPDNFSLGRPEVTGTLDVFVVDSVLYEKFLNTTQTSLAFTLTSGTDTLAFSMPSVKYTTGAMPIASGSAPRALNLNFRAFYDAGIGSELSITRSS